MRNFRRLPPLLRVASIVGQLFLLAAIALLAPALIAGWRSSPQLPADYPRVLLIVLNLSTFGGACSFAVIVYSLRFRQPDREPFPLSSWQNQLRAIALLGALPLCGIVLALMLPPDFTGFIPIAGITLLAAVMLVAAGLWALFRGSGLMRGPGAP